MTETKADNPYHRLILEAARQSGYSEEDSEKIASNLTELRQKHRARLSAKMRTADDAIHTLISGEALPNQDFAAAMQSGTPRQRHILSSLTYDGEILEEARRQRKINSGAN